MQNPEEEPILTEYDETNKLSKIIDRIGPGPFQLRIVAALSIFAFADGAEITLISIVSYILKSEWNLSTSELGILSGAILLGMSIGYFLSGILENSLGRTRIIHISLAILLVFGGVSGLMPNIWLLSVTRMFVGFAAALSTPAGVALIVELSPADMRSTYFLYIELFFTLGQIFIALMALVIVPDLNSENWRVLMVVSVLPVIPAIGLVYLYLLESPLDLAKNRKYEEAIENLNRIAKANGQAELTEEEVGDVFAVAPAHVSSGGRKIMRMFDKWHFPLTLNIFGLWSSIIVGYYGMLFMLPYILGSDDGNKTEIIYAFLITFSAQIPTVFLFMYIVENEFFGRKTTLIICTAVISLLTLVCGVFNQFIVIYVLTTVIISLCNAVFSILFLYTPEVYETDLRVTSVGIANVFGRLSGSLAIYGMFFVAAESTFAVLSGLSACYAVACITSVFLPFETRGKTLDFNAE